MSTVRLRRLAADHAKLLDYVRRHPRVRLVQAEGDPPERYQLEYCIVSLRMVNGELQRAKNHLVEIILPRNYPRTPPQCRMLSPVFHPNIAPHAICVGDHWSSGEPLVSIATRIGELLSYQAYNVKSPLNGEAARWVDQNRDKLPLDPVSLLVEEEVREKKQPTPVPPRRKAETAPSPTVPANSQPSPVETKTQAQLILSCPSCNKRYRVRENMVGRKVKCLQCETEFTLSVQESAPGS